MPTTAIPSGRCRRPKIWKDSSQPGEGCLVVFSRQVDLGQVPVGAGDPIEVTELLACLQPLELQFCRLVVVSPPVGDVCDLAPGDGGFPGVTEPFIDRQFYLAADAQRLVIVPPPFGDVGDLAPGDGGEPGVTEPLKDRQRHLAADLQRLVIVPPPVGDVRDLAPGEGGDRVSPSRSYTGSSTSRRMRSASS